MYTVMSREQRRLLEAMRSTTTDFAALTRNRDEFAGGMQWLTVKGKQYLSRYRRDPLSGEQRSTSLGRRTPETEAIYRQFLEGRVDLDRRMEALKPVMVEQARMAKALRLSRTPSDAADVARAIGLSQLADRVSLMGEAAVYGYECECGVLLPREVLPDDGLDLLVTGFDDADAVDEVATALRRSRVRVRTGRDEAVLRTESGLKIRLFTTTSLDRTISRYLDEEPDGEEAARWAIEQPTFSTICVDHDGRVVPVSLLDPRAYCILRVILIATDDLSVIGREMAAELNAEIIRLTHDRWVVPFEQGHVDSIGPLAAVLDEGATSPRL